MINLGKKESYPLATDGSSGKKEKTVYPHLSMYGMSKSLPVSSYKIGDTLNAEVRLKLISISENNDEKGKRYDYGFDVHSIGIKKDNNYFSKFRNM